MEEKKRFKKKELNANSQKNMKRVAKGTKCFTGLVAVGFALKKHAPRIVEVTKDIVLRR